LIKKKSLRYLALLLVESILKNPQKSLKQQHLEFCEKYGIYSDTDKNFLRNLTAEFFRKYFLLDFILKQTIDFPLHKLKRIEKNAIKLALYELLFSSHKDYAIVNETVEYFKTNINHRHSGLVNAILKNISIKKNEVTAKINNLPEHLRFSIPIWILENIENDNFLKPYKLQILDAFSTPIKKNIVSNNLIKNADYIQDKSSIFCAVIFAQLLKKYINLSKTNFDTLLVIDLCAAPGLKTVSCLNELGGDYILNNLTKLKFICCDINFKRLKLIKENILNYIPNNLNNRISIIQADASNFILKKEKHKIILFDAPCSGSGVISRYPEALVLRDKKNVINNSSMQKKIFANLYKSLMIGDIVIYSVCSIWQEECDAVIEFMLNNFKFAVDLSILDKSEINLKFNDINIIRTKYGLLLPPKSNVNTGFYLSILVKQ